MNRRTRRGGGEDESVGGDIISDAGGHNTATATTTTTPILGGGVTPRKGIRKDTERPYPTTLQQLKTRNTALQRSMFYLNQVLTTLTRWMIHYNHHSYLYTRLIVYLVVILAAGLIKDYLFPVLPDKTMSWIEYNLRTAKRSWINVYFVKLGWLWTLIALVPFFLFTRLYRVHAKDDTVQQAEPATSTRRRNYKTMDNGVPAHENDDQVDKQSVFIRNAIIFAVPFLRLAVATAIWYFSVELFVKIGKATGQCHSAHSATTVLAEYQSEKECVSQGNRWRLGFDISGHIFLMTFSNLIRIDELAYLLRNFAPLAEFHYLAQEPASSIQEFKLSSKSSKKSSKTSSKRKSSSTSKTEQQKEKQKQQETSEPGVCFCCCPCLPFFCLFPCCCCE